MVTKPQQKDAQDGVFHPNPVEQPQALLDQGVSDTYGPRYIRAAGNQTKQLEGGGSLTLDEQGRVASIKNVYGSVTSFHRDGQGKIDGYQMTDASGRSLETVQRENGVFSVRGLQIKQIEAGVNDGIVTLVDTSGVLHERLPQGNAIRVNTDMPPTVPRNGRNEAVYPVTAEITPTGIKSEYHYATAGNGAQSQSQLDQYTLSDKQGHILEMARRQGDQWVRYRSIGPGDFVDPNNLEKYKEKDALEIPTRVTVDARGVRTQTFPTGEATQSTASGGVLHRHVDGLFSRTEPGNDGAQHLVYSDSISNRYGVEHNQFFYDRDGKLSGLAVTTDAVGADGQKQPHKIEYIKQGDQWVERQSGKPAPFSVNDGNDGSITFSYKDQGGKVVRARTLNDDGSEVISEPAGNGFRPIRVLSAAGADTRIHYDGNGRADTIDYQFPNGVNKHLVRGVDPQAPQGRQEFWADQAQNQGGRVYGHPDVDRYGTINWQYLNRDGRITRRADDPRNIPPPEIMQQTAPQDQYMQRPPMANRGPMRMPPRPMPIDPEWQNPDGSPRTTPRSQWAR